MIVRVEASARCERELAKIRRQQARPTVGLQVAPLGIDEDTAATPSRILDESPERAVGQHALAVVAQDHHVRRLAGREPLQADPPPRRRRTARDPPSRGGSVAGPARARAACGSSAWHRPDGWRGYRCPGARSPPAGVHRLRRSRRRRRAPHGRRARRPVAPRSPHRPGGRASCRRARPAPAPPERCAPPLPARTRRASGRRRPRPRGRETRLRVRSSVGCDGVESASSFTTAPLQADDRVPRRSRGCRRRGPPGCAPSYRKAPRSGRRTAAQSGHRTGQ